MQRVYLFISELANMRHIIVNATHIINTAAINESNVYHIINVKQAKDKTDKEDRSG